MKNNLIEFLTDVFLFSNVSQEKIIEILNGITPEIKKYSRKDEIYTPHDYEHKLCFILSGECTVERVRCDGNSVPLNTLKKGQSFGIMTILSCEEEFPTRVVAKRDSEILFISKTDTLRLIQTYPNIAMNVINFLAKKISFLNTKVATFSSSTVEAKLSNYILSECKKQMSAEISFNCKKSAEAISAGRASLYRAIASLTEAGIIKLENQKIYILDREGLERNSK
ncbi:MAG: Crp/Fnr family transcriptional regulator [Ruminococcaceae bacterium]|nr:Crp/Fnr family transcriptional regulator [Oscillospiraceae bacterium]